jgi:FlaA1/EpsC-like NDP-sugar epimerase
MDSDDYYKHEKVFEGKNLVVTGATGEICSLLLLN